ncbi:TPA: hypothetical protein ACF0PM_002246 [Clostridium perfringens]
MKKMSNDELMIIRGGISIKELHEEEKIALKNLIKDFDYENKDI